MFQYAVISTILLGYRTLNHPNILALLGVVCDQSSVTLIMNFVNGWNLHSIIFGTEPKMEVGKASNMYLSSSAYYRLHFKQRWNLPFKYARPLYSCIRLSLPLYTLIQSQPIYW